MRLFRLEIKRILKSRRTLILLAIALLLSVAMAWHIDGTIMEWDYNILDRSGYSIARVSKELFHMTDTYVIDVQDPGNALGALMFVLAIDAEKCSRN